MMEQARPAARRWADAVPPFAMAAFGILILTIMDGFAKELSARHPVPQLSFLRFSMGTVVAVVLFLLLRAPLPGMASIGVNVVRGLFTTVTSVSFFFALSVLPIADVFALTYLVPLVVAALSIPMLGERPTPRAWGAIALGFAGAMVTIGGMGIGALDRLEGAAAALVSVLAYALVILLLRRQATRDPAITIVLFQSLVPTVCLALPAGLAWQPVANADLPLFAGMGVLGVGGHLAMANAFARAEANKLVSVEYTGFIWAALMGLFVFGEMLKPETAIGAVLVIAACWMVRK